MPKFFSLPSESRHGYISELDGLRAISILMVIYGHLSFGVLPKPLRATTIGPAGVVIFFVISGYLITNQLMEEKAQWANIDLGRFLLRRLLRLFPALLVLLVTAAVFKRLGWIAMDTRDLIHGFTYTMDYFQPKFPALEHLWSLSVEEQFYLLWPICFSFARGRWLVQIPMAALSLCPVVRLLEWNAGIPQPFRRFECVADCLAMGCLLALIPQRKMPRWGPLAGFAVVLLCAFLEKHAPASKVMLLSVESLGAAVIVGGAVAARYSHWRSVLTWPPLVWVGKISYSLYLWQQLFLLPGQHNPPLFPFPLNLATALAAAAASYYCVEQPIRDFARRFKRPYHAASTQKTAGIESAPPFSASNGR